ncbi:MAG: hypothetical protein RSA40_02535 [Malacoplasma sp.]
MSKMKIVIFYIITLGIGYFVLKAKAKKQATVINDKLITTDKVPFAIDKLFDALGGKDNVVKCSSTINSIKIFIKNVTLIKQDDLKKMGSKGLILSEDSITCLFGDFSQSLDKLICQNL